MSLSRSKENDQVLGYHLIARLGAGGFGEVWKARAPGGLLKAIKFVYGDLSGRQAGQEARALELIREVRHPFLLSLERVEVVEGQLVIVSELADKTLLDRFEECRAEGRHGIPRGELLRYMHDAAEVLDYITVQFRLQHLDIKPSNLLLMGGRLKVGDLGLVREACHRTGTSTGGLSPAYAPPELFASEFSLYSDQYSLAVVYQEMLTGTRPFRGRTSLQLSQQHLRARPNLAPLSGQEQAIIGRALSKNPNERFPSCADMVRALAGVDPAEPANGPRDEPLAGDESSDPHRLSLQRIFRSLDLERSQAALPTPSEVTLQTLAGEGSDRPPGSEEGPASELLLSGLPEPTLFLGIGGIGGYVLRQARRLFQARLEDPSARGRLGWLVLDTDRSALHEIRRPEVAGHLLPEETALMPLHGPDHYRPHLKQLLGWLGRHWLFRIPRSHRTEGIRPLGRLALLDNADEALGRIRQAVRRFKSRLADELEPRRVRIVVVAGIAGGTGGGCLVDIGFSLRRILGEEGLAAASVAGLLVQAASVRRDERELARANAHVTLSELRHFLDPGSRFPGVKALGLEPSEGETPLFDHVSLADLGDVVGEDDVDDGARLIAEYVFLDRGTPYGQAQQRERSPGAATPLRGFRLARLGFPRAQLRRLVAQEVCLRVVQRWLQGPPARRAAEDTQPPASSEPVSLPGAREPTLLCAPNYFALMGLDEEAFEELFLERVERASGSDPLKFFRRQANELVQVRRRSGPRQAIVRFLDELDERFGPGAEAPADRPRIPPFERKLRDEFQHDRRELEGRLEGWIRTIVESPAGRLPPARDALHRLSARLVAEIDATPARINSLKARRGEIRARHAGARASRLPFPILRKSVPGDPGPILEELCEYGLLWIRETALRVRGDLLTAILGRTSLLEEELNKLHQGLEGVRRLFQPTDPGFFATSRASLGSLEELFPVSAESGAQLRGLLTDSFCNERRLSTLDREFQEEVSEAHGGLLPLLAREPRVVSEILDEILFQRVACAVGHWLEGQDAASILLQRLGALDDVTGALLETWRSMCTGLSDRVPRRLVVAIPASPSGRTLREGIARSELAPAVGSYVAIADDLVLCLELEELDFSGLTAALASGEEWLTELAPKLVTRNDVAWTGLDGA